VRPAAVLSEGGSCCWRGLVTQAVTDRQS